MPPKDRTKFVSKMNNEELKIVAKNIGINIDGANTAAKKRKVIIAASAGYTRRYDFNSNTWITGTEDVMQSTQAITGAEDEEDQEDPRTDDAKKIQKLVRARQEKKKNVSHQYHSECC